MIEIINTLSKKEKKIISIHTQVSLVSWFQARELDSIAVLDELSVIGNVLRSLVLLESDHAILEQLEVENQLAIRAIGPWNLDRAMSGFVELLLGFERVVGDEHIEVWHLVAEVLHHVLQQEVALDIGVFANRFDQMHYVRCYIGLIRHFCSFFLIFIFLLDFLLLSFFEFIFFEKRKRGYIYTQRSIYSLEATSLLVL